ncbi:MAG: hypothetical protein ACLR1T_04130 [Evtepia gabavorous]
MDQKNRTILVLAIAVTVFAAVFVSLGLPALTGRAPEVVLPDVNQEAVSTEGRDFLPVEVRPDTVQSVIASLSRPESYYRQLTVRLFWAGGSSADPVEIWADGGYVRTAITTGEAPNTGWWGRESSAFGMPGTAPGRRWTPGMTPLIWPSGFPPMRMCWSWIQNRLARPVMRRKTRRTVSLWR